MELPEAIHIKIAALSKQGDALAEKAQYKQAIEKYTEAYRLLPKPQTDWDACTWLTVAIGDAHFLSKNYDSTKQALTDAMRCPGAIGNPFIHMRLGQAQLELGNKERAADELTRAYMGGGKDIFATENPKYFEFLKTAIKPPANGKW